MWQSNADEMLVSALQVPRFQELRYQGRRLLPFPVKQRTKTGVGAGFGNSTMITSLTHIGFGEAVSEMIIMFDNV